MSNPLLTLAAKLSLDSTEYEKGLDDAEGKAGNFGSKLKNGLSTAGKVAAKSVATVAAGVATLATSAVKSYADYEQLSGGIDTLFGDSAQKVMDNANKAFKTAGLSVNEYMETSIQSAASLINSLGGDQEKATEIMDMSITDMADNVNKMGTSMEAVQNAYKGFSRGNFTMLDNLALGFAGTKEGMQKLLEKATELAKSNGTLDDSNMKLVVDDELVEKATDSLAKAQNTLESRQIAAKKSQISYNEALKKYGENSSQAQKAALSLSEANRKLEQASNGVVEAQIALEDAQRGTLVGFDIKSYSDIVQAIHVVQDEMGITGTTSKEAEGTISGSLASLKSGFQNLITAIASGDGDIDGLLDNLVTGAEQVLNNILPIGEKALSGIGTVLGKLVPIIIKKVPEILKNVLPNLLSSVGDIITSIVTSIPDLVGTIGDLATILLPAAFELIRSLGQGLSTSLPSLIPQIVSIVMQLVETLTDPEQISMLVDTAINLVMALLDGILDAIPIILDALPKIIANIATAIVMNLPKILMKIPEIIIKIVQSIIQNIPTLIKIVPQIIKEFVSAITKNGPQIAKIGTQLIQGLWNGISNAGAWLWDKISGFFGGIVNNIKGFFGIKSPSKLFAGIGEMLDKGLAKGISDYSGVAEKSAINMAEDVANAMDNELLSGELSRSIDINNANGLTAGARAITMNIYGAVGQDVSELAEIVSQKIAFGYAVERRAFA